MSGLISSIVISLFTSIYYGFLVSKYAEFRSLREEACRVIHSNMTASNHAEEINLIANSLDRLNHKKAAQNVREIAKEFIALGKSAKDSNEQFIFPTPNEAVNLIEKRNNLRVKLKTLKPSARSIIFPF